MCTPGPQLCMQVLEKKRRQLCIGLLQYYLSMMTSIQYSLRDFPISVRSGRIYCDYFIISCQQLLQHDFLKISLQFVLQKCFISNILHPYLLFTSLITLISFLKRRYKVKTKPILFTYIKKLYKTMSVYYYYIVVKMIEFISFVVKHK